MGVASTCQSSLAWSSSQFRVTLPCHVRLESNLLWWKDKETLIEILPLGHFVLSFHMGLTSFQFSSRLVVHALSDPVFATTKPHKEEFEGLDSMWKTVKYKQNVCIVPCKLIFWPYSRQKLFSFHLTKRDFFLSLLFSWLYPSFTVSSHWSLTLLKWMNVLEMYFFPPDFHSLHHLPGPESLKPLFPFALENQRLSLSVLKKHPFLCFCNIMHLMSASTCGAEVLCKYFAAFVVFSAVFLSNFHI